LKEKCLCITVTLGPFESKIFIHYNFLPLNASLYITLTMILYENMKRIEHVLLHPIRVLSHLMCACTEHIEAADEFITLNNTNFTRFFIIKPRYTGGLKKHIWVEKNSVVALVTCGKMHTTVK